MQAVTKTAETAVGHLVYIVYFINAIEGLICLSQFFMLALFCQMQFRLSFLLYFRCFQAELAKIKNNKNVF